MAAARLVAARLEQSSTALFVCDVQERFANAIHGFQHMVDASAKLIKGAAILQVPIFATEQNPKALGSTVSTLKQHLPQSSSAILPKTRFSMVLPSGETEQFLKEKQIKTVLLVGIESHVCVLQTCLDLLRLGYGVYIIRDAISSCNKEEVPTAIEDAIVWGYSDDNRECLVRIDDRFDPPKFQADQWSSQGRKRKDKGVTRDLDTCSKVLMD